MTDSTTKTTSALLLAFAAVLGLGACDGEEAPNPDRVDEPSLSAEHPLLYAPSLDEATILDVVEGRFPAPVISSSFASAADEHCPQSEAAQRGELDRLAPPLEVEIDQDDALLLDTALVDACVRVGGGEAQLVACASSEGLEPGYELIALGGVEELDLEAPEGPEALPADWCYFCSWSAWCWGSTKFTGHTINEGTQCLGIPNGCC